MEPKTKIDERFDELQKQIDELNKKPLEDHYHTGFDVSRIYWSDINQKKQIFNWTIQGPDAATAAYYSVIWVAPFACYINSFKEVHQTAGTDGGAVTLMLEKLTGTQAPDSGVDVLSSTLSLKATANTVQTGTITSTLANRTLAGNDRLCLKDTGVLTSVANVTVVVEIIII